MAKTIKQNELKFCVVSWSHQKVTLSDETIDFYIEQDGWNDYSFYTFYYLHIGKKHTTNNENLFVGYIRIQRKGQEEGEKFLLKEGRILTHLEDSFVSHTSDLEFYEILNKSLDVDVRYSLAQALNLVALDVPHYKEELKDDECFITSLLVGGHLDSNDMEIAKELLLSPGKIFFNVNENIKAKLTGIKGELELNFGVINNAPEELMPNRMCVLVGHNGSGKSTVMYKLSKLIYASIPLREHLKDDIGHLFPKEVSFTKLIMFSYSALDNFTLPSEILINISDQEQLIQDGKFIYCGLRDILKENTKLERKVSSKDNYIEDINIKDRQEINICKSVNTLSREFSVILKAVKADKSKRDTYLEVLNIMQKEESFSSISEEIRLVEDDEFINFFLQLSTGHKFVIHSLVHLIYYIQPSSLAMFDEPENHLHPSLLAVYMQSVRFILTRRKAVMLVATHSSIVLQETMSSNIVVVKKEGDIIYLDKPHIQTFGENLDRISSEVFDLTPTMINYKNTLDILLKEAMKTDPFDRDEEYLMKVISTWFEYGLSNQATAYLVNKLFRFQQNK